MTATRLAHINLYSDSFESVDEYDSYVALVCDRIDDLAGYEVAVSAARFGESGRTSADAEDDREAERLVSIAQDIWDMWCAGEEAAQ